MEIQGLLSLSRLIELTRAGSFSVAKECQLSPAERIRDRCSLRCRARARRSIESDYDWIYIERVRITRTMMAIRTPREGDRKAYVMLETRESRALSPSVSADS